MGTLLSELYTRFNTKVDENLNGKQSLIFSLVDSAIAKSNKHCINKLTYTLDNPDVEDETNDYQGNFDYTLDTDEIELIALQMLYDWNRRRQQYLLGQRNMIGTSDFNRLPDKSSDLKSIAFAMKMVNDDIITAQNNLYEYKAK
jgi:hypothetical protein